MRFGRARLGTGRQQVRSHPASGLSQLQKALGQLQSLDAPSIATESTLIARAGVYRSARLWARWNRAALPPRVLPLGLGCPARKRVVWASGRKRRRVAWLPRPLLALRSLWGGLGTVPGPSLCGWEAASVALCGASLAGEAIFAPPTFPRLPPLGCKSQKFGLIGWGC